MQDARPVSEVGAAAAESLRTAYGAALRHGRAVVDTGLVLAAIARDNREAWPILGHRVLGRIRAAAARQDWPRTGSAGVSPAVPVPPSCPYRRALREARWRAARNARRRDAALVGSPAQRSDPAWSETVCSALRRAADAAGTAGVGRIGMPHLVLGLLNQDDPAIRSLAAAVGLDLTAAATSAQAGKLDVEPEPDTPLITYLTMFGASEEPTPWAVRWIPRLLARLMSRNDRAGGPVRSCIELEAMRQAAITGHHSVQTTHLLLAVISMHAQLQTSAIQLRPPLRPHNHGGTILLEAGIDLDRAQHTAEDVDEPGPDLPAEESTKVIQVGIRPEDPNWREAAIAVLDRAGQIARQHQHHNIGTSHLLAAVLEDPASAAVRMLARCGLDPKQLQTRSHDMLTNTPAPPPGSTPSGI